VKGFLRVISVCLLALGCAPGDARAADAQASSVQTQGPVTPADIETARSYRKWADAFGESELAFVAVDEKNARLMMEYLPPGQTVTDWNRMVTIHVIGLPDDKAAAGEAAFGYIDRFRQQVAGLKQSGLAVELKGFAGFTSEAEGDTPGDKPRHALYQFALGEKTPDEDNAGVIFPAEKRLINFQLQRRNGKTVTEAELGQLQDFLMKQMGTQDATVVDGPAIPAPDSKKQDNSKDDKSQKED
jgi:hypothetical protein